MKALFLLCFVCGGIEPGFTQDRVNIPPEEARSHLLNRVDPVYSPLAREARIEGSVTLRVLVSKSGTVTSATVISGHHMLVQSALDVVKYWVFQPFLVEGKPAEASTTVVLPFALDKNGPTCQEREREFAAKVALTDQEREFMYRGPAKAVAFSPDGRSLAIADCDKGLAVWDIGTGKLRFKLTSTAQVSALAFDNIFDFHFDTRWLAFVGSDNKTIELWDAFSGTKIRSLQGHASEVYAVAFNLPSTEVVSVDRDGSLKVWDAATGQELKNIRVGRMQSAVLSSDGVWLAAKSPKNASDASSGEEIKLLNVADGGLIRTIPAGPERGVMAFSRIGRLFADADSKGIRIYDVVTGDMRREITFDKYIECTSLAFSPDGRWLAVGEKDELEYVTVWEVDTGQQLLHILPEGTGDRFVTFSADGQWLAYTDNNYVTKEGRTEEQETVELRNIAVPRRSPGAGNQLAIREGEPNLMESLAVADNGSKLVSVGFDGMLRVWEASGAPGRAIKAGGLASVQLSALSPDGKLLAAIVTGKDRISGVKVWHTDTGEELHTFDVPEAKFQSDGPPVLGRITFSPDGRWLALGSFCKIILLDVATGQKRRTLTVTPDPIEMLTKEHALSDIVLLGYVVMKIAFSPDGRLLAVVPTLPNSLQLWDTRTGEKVKEINMPPHRPEELFYDQFRFTGFSSDGRLLFGVNSHLSREDTSGAKLVTYDAATLRELRSVPTSRELFLGFIAGSERGLLVSQRDNELNVLDVSTGKVMRAMTLDSSDSPVVVLSSNGKWLAAANDSAGHNSISLWDLSTGEHALTIAGFPIRQLHWDEKTVVVAQPMSSTSRPVQPSSEEQNRPVVPLPAPLLLSPADGAVFDHYPRYTTLVWVTVPAATGYVVEWDYKHAKGWQSEYTHAATVFHTHDPTYSFNFVGAQPGRWRVWAVDAHGDPGAKSEWREFSYTH